LFFDDFGQQLLNHVRDVDLHEPPKQTPPLQGGRARYTALLTDLIANEIRAGADDPRAAVTAVPAAGRSPARGR
jgi:hypothetical protein